MTYLMIANPGVAYKEAFTLLGTSTKRKSDNPNLIGFFGSGAKHAIAKLLRGNLDPIIFAGTLKMTFGRKNADVREGNKVYRFHQATVTYSGKEYGKTLSRTDELGWTIGFGELDWTETAFALREFVSNAIDRAYEYGEENFLKTIANIPDDLERATRLASYRETTRDFNNVRIELVENNRVRAKDGETRVFIPIGTDEGVFKFYTNLNKWYLHFGEPENLHKTILPKGNRDLTGKDQAVIYKKGVRIRTVGEESPKSLFDYNLKDLQLDESRNVDDYRVHTSAGRALRDASVEDLTKLLSSFGRDKTFWEHKIPDYALDSTYGEGAEKQELRHKRWEKALETVAGKGSIIGRPGFAAETAVHKGFTVLEAPEAFVDKATDLGLKTPMQILSNDEQEGRTIYDDSPEEFTDCLNLVWAKLTEWGKTFDKEKPELKSFDALVQGEGTCLGYYTSGGNTVYINRCQRGGISVRLIQTVLEEIAHYVTGSKDSTRDFQEFFMGIISELIYESKN